MKAGRVMGQSSNLGPYIDKDIRLKLLDTVSLSNHRHNFLVDLPLKDGSKTLNRLLHSVYRTGFEPLPDI